VIIKPTITLYGSKIEIDKDNLCFIGDASVYYISCHFRRSKIFFSYFWHAADNISCEMILNNLPLSKLNSSLPTVFCLFLGKYELLENANRRMKLYKNFLQKLFNMLSDSIFITLVTPIPYPELEIASRNANVQLIRLSENYPIRVVNPTEQFLIGKFSNRSLFSFDGKYLNDKGAHVLAMNMCDYFLNLSLSETNNILRSSF
jgi:hypothetical protein